MSQSDKAEWREYALLQVLLGEPVTPYEQWCELPLVDGPRATIRHRHPHLTDEEVEGWANTT